MILPPVATHSSTGIAPLIRELIQRWPMRRHAPAFQEARGLQLKRTGVYRPGRCRCSISFLYSVEDLFIGLYVTHIGGTEDQQDIQRWHIRHRVIGGRSQLSCRCRPRDLTHDLDVGSGYAADRL